MLHVQRAVVPAVLFLAALVLVAGCGEPATPPPGAPDEARPLTVEQGEPATEESTTASADAAPSDTSADEAETGWGTLTGRIVFDGTAPVPQTIEPVTTSPIPARMNSMTETGQNLLHQALRLSADERAVLAANLWASLETDSDPDVEAAWAEEIRRRLKRIELGEDQPVPWEEIRGRLRAKFAR